MESSGISLASARAGNVIGGGDWSDDRLVPDILKTIDHEKILNIRYPNATRPWQHVLEPVYGYLLLAEKLFVEGSVFAEGWNFGPADDDAKSVKWIVEQIAEMHKNLKWECDDTPQPHEASYLKLDSSKAKSELDWEPCWNLKTALEKTLEWHEAWRNNDDMASATISQIEAYQLNSN
jgi:CDP-glucose 4,6-dehydratase